MRPVCKGDSPYASIGHYSEALPYLEAAIGTYCSYCGFRIDHVPEVEHVSSKSKGGDETAWSNLLLGCKYCNSRKKDKVTPANVDEYLWPDKYNTALAFTYQNGIPKVNEGVLSGMVQHPDALQMARNIFDLVGLDSIPEPKSKDRRYESRNKACNIAKDSLLDWSSCHCDQMLRQITRTALAHGFFSVWMTVFAEEPEVLNALIEVFPGTRKAFFDENGQPKPILIQGE